jgi:putative glutamine amidotransferase
VKRPPVIGITCLETQTEQEQSSPRFCQNQSYIRAVVAAGGVPLLIPHLSDKVLLRALYERLDGLLLPGGEDIDPAHYGEPRHKDLRRVTPTRDETELTLTRWSMDSGMPLLAICRGIQVLNVALGGSLYQDIQAQIPQAQRHDWYPGYARDHLPHTVAVTPHTHLFDILGTDSLPVNSLHHQAIKDIAPGLKPVAQAPDQVIEGVEALAHPFAIGVQWHPEELAANDVRAQRLFAAQIKACQG